MHTANNFVFKISAALLVGLLGQGGAIVWWSSKLDQRVAVLEQWKEQNDKIVERVARVEERVSAVQVQGTRIEDKIDRLIERPAFRRQER